MQYSVSIYSYGTYRAEDKLGLEGIIRKTKELGFDGIDFTGYSPDTENVMGIAQRARELCGELGLAINNVCFAADFLNGSNGVLKDEIERVKKCVDIAEAFGVKLMRHDPGHAYPVSVKTGRSFDCAIPRLAEGCREVTKYAEQKGIETCIENHGQFAQDAERVEKLINEVDSPNFGALVDIGNFMCADQDPAKAVGILAPYAKYAHAKDFYFKEGYLDNPGEGWFMSRAGNYLKGAIIGHGAVPVRQCINILKKAGYDKGFSIEFEGKEDNIEGIRIGLANLRRFCEDKI
ncbi:MAG: sugar phosphate isomerase/epimerase [Ruminococcaceae bacterium]|nr:sugar phosphate isomerase/epimerase [Oscillospiraceae bacterium]